ncbi:AraC family transcriptional regulator [Novosphingobium sp. KCTC 2891]|uniref:helix-turn-helix domain-containing protein n=1 Tax=Novosphingobium sp. KCTC 2891 TaxID=2989730 RepID=UPI002221318D|nr:AraC family transcriptional regulator [Novosphingobium sp. KCTC 2891]MCW1382152.1 AraC family transcriptional regulator [Novosphingobium sp. KCTC 2891]
MTEAADARLGDSARKRALLAQERLISPSLIQLDYLAPPPEMAPFVTTFFLFRCDETHIADVQPAGVGLLAVFMRGRGELFLRDGTVDASHLVNLVTPLSAAAPILMEGPWHTFGAALSPLGWAALTGGLSASDHGNRMRNAAELIGEPLQAFGEALTAAYNGPGISNEAMVAMASEALAPLMRPVPAAHIALIGQVAEWMGGSLSPKVDDLLARAPYSPRQLQRLVDKYFGLPPKQLARKYRALRAAALLAHPGTSPDELALVAEQFYDQPHMIRELRLFTGRTPARLGAPDLPVLSALLDLRNFREVKPRIAAMPPGFGA